MGHDLSRIVDTLYPLPTNQRLAALEQLLQNKNLLKNLAKGAKSTNFSFTLQRTSRKPKPTALQNLTPCSVVDAKVLDAWSKDLTNFWVSAELQLDPWDGRLASFYDGTKKVAVRHGLDAIRGRFQKLFYRDLLYLLNPLAADDKAAAHVYNQLADLIAPESKVTQDPNIVQSNLKDWVRAGRRYHKLTTTFGPAILFILPESLSIDFLEKRLPLGDEAYDTITKTLSPLGEYAKNLVGANGIAERLRNATLQSYAFLTEELSSPANRSAPRSQNGRREPRLAIAMPSNPRADSGVDSSMPDRTNRPAIIPAMVQLENELYNGQQNVVQNSVDTLAYAHHGVNDPQQGGLAAHASKEIAITNRNQCEDPENKSRLQYYATPTGDPMLSNFIAGDWEDYDSDVFRPVPFETETDPELFQPQHFQEDGDEDIFLPESFGLLDPPSTT